MNQSIPEAAAFVFDSNKLKRFLYQVAVARVLANTTRAHWSAYESSVVLNTLYNVLNQVSFGRYAGPGFMEVDAPPQRQLRQQILESYPRLWKEFAARARQGPMPMKSWLDHQQACYQDDTHYLQRIFLEARRINQQVDEQLRVAIFRLAEVKFVSEVALNVLGLIPGGGALGLAVRLSTGIGYPILVNVIENWNRVGAAQMTLSVAASTAAQNLPSLAGEDLVVSKAQFLLVDKPSLEAAHMRALRKLPGGWKGAKVKAQVMGKEADAALAQLGIKTTTTVLQGVACWFCYQSCQDSANQFWQTITQ